MDGIGRVVAELVPELVASGEHEFLVLYHEDWTRGQLAPRLPAGCGWLRLTYPVLSAADMVRLPADLRQARIDLLHTFNYPTSPLHRGYAVAAMVHDLIPFLFPDGGAPPSRRWRLFYASKLPARLLLGRMAGLHVPSARTAADLARLFPGVERKVVVAPNGVRPARPLPEPELAGRLAELGLAPGYILYVGGY